MPPNSLKPALMWAETINAEQRDEYLGGLLRLSPLYRRVGDTSRRRFWGLHEIIQSSLSY